MQIRAPRAGTLRNLHIRQNGAGTGTSTVTYTVRINGVATAVTIGLLVTATNGADTVNSVAVAIGDAIDIIVTKAGGTTTSPTRISATLEID